MVFKCEPEVASPLLSILSSVASVGAREGLLPSESSALNLALGLVSASEGVFWPVGGYSALVQALCATIQESGGEVYRDVKISKLVIETPAAALGNSAAEVFKASGVEVYLNSGSDSNDSEKSSVVLEGSQSVVSGMGVLCTYTRLLPTSGVTNCISTDTRAALNGLTETRPRHRVVYWVDCSTAIAGSGNSNNNLMLNLGLSATDYFEIGSCSVDGEDSNSDALSNSKYLHIWSPSIKDPVWKLPKIHIVIVEFDANEALFVAKDVQVSSSDVSQDSAYNEAQVASSSSSTTGATSSQPSLGQTVSLSHTTVSAVRNFADDRLAHAYPLVMSHIVCVSVQPLRVGGHALANTIQKYTSAISSTTDIQVSCRILY